MARKNNSRSEASGSIHFDSRTKAVMAEATQDNIKEKVQAVREVVLHKSNNEVVMVLQYYDYSVERAIQAYLEDGAKEALQEWSVSGSKQPKKRKNKKKAGSDKPGDKTGPSPGDLKVDPPLVNGKTELPNGDLQNGEKSDVESTAETEPKIATQELTQAAATAPTTSPPAASVAAPVKTKETATSAAQEPLPQRQAHKGKGHGDSHASQQHHHQNNRERTISEVSTSSGMGDGHHKKPFQGLEKAIKDLHRQTTSLERLKQLLDHEIDRSYKSMKSVFEELRQGLSSREALLLAEMDLLKKEASEMLSMRQNKAVELRRQVDRADKLKDSEVSELRAEIKHFVSERRQDEEIGHTTRFMFDSDHLLDEIKKFGEVMHVKSMYSARKMSISSVASSSVSHNDDHSHSQEVSELQDRLKTSLKLSNSYNQDSSTVDRQSPSANVSKDPDFKPSRNNNRRRPASSRQSQPDSVSPSLDVNSNKATTLSTSAAGGTSSSSSTYSPYAPSTSYRSNTGSPGRGGRGGSYGPRGGSRGRGRGGPRGRGGYGGDGPRPQGQNYSRPYSGASSAGRQADPVSS
ncbi:spermatogenesis-associated serine-rich protein 2 [Bulinus truncatus]|nr:spermatogenesis-associated serine-rich protein 2 [Bulinus truncatus]